MRIDISLHFGVPDNQIHSVLVSPTTKFHSILVSPTTSAVYLICSCRGQGNGVKFGCWEHQNGVKFDIWGYLNRVKLKWNLNPENKESIIWETYKVNKLLPKFFKKLMQNGLLVKILKIMKTPLSVRKGVWDIQK